MSEYAPQPSPLQLLIDKHPDVVHSSIVAKEDGCFCGKCSRELSEYEATELDRCPNIETCGTGWVRVLATAPYSELPVYSFRLGMISARGMLERKHQEGAPVPVVTGADGTSRSIAHAAINRSYL